MSHSEKKNKNSKNCSRNVPKECRKYREELFVCRFKADMSSNGAQPRVPSVRPLANASFGPYVDDVSNGSGVFSPSTPSAASGGLVTAAAPAPPTAVPSSVLRRARSTSSFANAKQTSNTMTSVTTSPRVEGDANAAVVSSGGAFVSNGSMSVAPAASVPLTPRSRPPIGTSSPITGSGNNKNNINNNVAAVTSPLSRNVSSSAIISRGNNDSSTTSPTDGAGHHQREQQRQEENKKEEVETDYTYVQPSPAENNMPAGFSSPAVTVGIGKDEAPPTPSSPSSVRRPLPLPTAVSLTTVTPTTTTESSAELSSSSKRKENERKEVTLATESETNNSRDATKREARHDLSPRKSSSAEEGEAEASPDAIRRFEERVRQYRSNNSTVRGARMDTSISNNQNNYIKSAAPQATHSENDNSDLDEDEKKNKEKRALKTPVAYVRSVVNGQLVRYHVSAYKSDLTRDDSNLSRAEATNKAIINDDNYDRKVVSAAVGEESAGPMYKKIDDEEPDDPTDHNVVSIADKRRKGPTGYGGVEDTKHTYTYASGGGRPSSLQYSYEYEAALATVRSLAAREEKSMVVRGSDGESKKISFSPVGAENQDGRNSSRFVKGSRDHFSLSETISPRRVYSLANAAEAVGGGTATRLASAYIERTPTKAEQQQRTYNDYYNMDDRATNAADDKNVSTISGVSPLTVRHDTPADVSLSPAGYGAHQPSAFFLKGDGGNLSTPQKGYSATAAPTTAIIRSPMVAPHHTYTYTDPYPSRGPILSPPPVAVRGQPSYHQQQEQVGEAKSFLHVGRPSSTITLASRDDFAAELRHLSANKRVGVTVADRVEEGGEAAEGSERKGGARSNNHVSVTGYHDRRHVTVTPYTDKTEQQSSSFSYSSSAPAAGGGGSIHNSHYLNPRYAYVADSGSAMASPPPALMAATVVRHAYGKEASSPNYARATAQAREVDLSLSLSASRRPRLTSVETIY